MAAGSITAAEWKKINREFDADSVRYGLPERVYGSAVLGSFNIRKLGAASKRSAATWRFLGRICARFDLLAVQEVLDDLSGLERLRAEMGDEYELIVSDTTGAFHGERGLKERMAFVYRRSLVRRASVVSDITYDRSKILNILYENFDAVAEAVDVYRRALARFEAGRRRKRPKLDMPVFLSFIRQPFAVSFRVVGHPEAQPYEFMAVNAHLIYGEMADRKREFAALMEWIIAREKATGDDTEYPGYILLGDLNLDFNNPATDIGDIQRYLESFPNRSGDEIKVRFPFLEKHPGRNEVFRTNARQRETYDHIGLFYRAERIPEEIRTRKMGANPRGPDHGVVNFVELFSKALTGKVFADLPKRRHKAFYAKFEYSVSDHMPIWLRIPLPD